RIENFGQQNQDIANQLKVQDLDLPQGVSADRGLSRAAFRDALDSDFLADHPGLSGEGHRTAYRRANTLMRSSAAKAFDLTEQQKGRDHWAVSWSTVLAGGGIKGGQVIGATSADGMEVKDHPVIVLDLLSTVCKAVGLDPSKQNDSLVGRPIRLVEPTATAIKE